MAPRMAAPATPYRAKRMWHIGLVAVLALAGCSEPETILVGKRENIRSQTEAGATAGIAVAAPENQSKAITLPRPVVNMDWVQGIGTPASRTAHPQLAQDLSIAWSADIGAGDSRRQRITANPVVSDGRIFTLDAATTVSALGDDGTVLWQVDIKPARDNSGEATGGGLAVAQGTLYVAHGYGMLVALDVKTGAEKWRQALGGTGSGAPAVSGGIVYVTAGDDTGWAIDGANGRVLWQTTAPANVNNVLGAPAPAVSRNFAIFGFGSGDVHAIFRRGGLRRWGTAVVGEREGRALAKVGDLTGAPVVDGNTAFVGNQSGRLVALDLGLGARLWTAAEGTTGPVFPVGGSVFAVSDQNALLRLDAKTGARIWAQPLPHFVKDRPRKRSEVFVNYGPILAGGLIYVASSDGALRAFDPVDGTLAHQTALPRGASTAPVVANGTLYLVTTAGQLLALR